MGIGLPHLGELGELGEMGESFSVPSCTVASHFHTFLRQTMGASTKLCRP